MENDLGGVLFDRSGRAVRLTDFGSAYIEYARRALLDLEAGQRALHDVRDLSRGQLRLAFTPTFTEYLVTPVIDQFHSAHPHIAIEMTEMSLDAIESGLGGDRFDLAIGFTDIRSDDIEVEALFPERMTLVVSASHPVVAERTPIASSRLATWPLALLSGQFVFRFYVDAYFASQGIKPNVAIEANSISAVLKIVSRGKVATLLPSAMQYEHRDLKYIALEPAIPARTVALLRRKGAYRTAAATAFSAMLKEMLEEGALSSLSAFAR
ncbi:transcriptional regulator CynR [Paraburkholderia sp. BL10I2N1]|uniref:transcriptional regulator CynR n=1 Tax=Paraburkholderia sp. BL10I2N1 TaxID=1938796 RepID=UPI0026BC8CDC